MFSLTSICAYFLVIFYFLSWFPNHLSPTILRKMFGIFSKHRAIQLMVSLGWFGAFLGSVLRMSPPCHKPWLNEIKKLGSVFLGGERAS